MVSQGMLTSLLERQLTFVPQPIPFYTFHNNAWTPSTSHDVTPDISTTTLSSLTLITWNIDFQAPEPRARMAAALSHLERLVSDIPASHAAIIFLQEMREDASYSGASDLTQIAAAPWVRARFNVTDVNSDAWDAAYGQVTLVDRRLTIDAVWRLHLISEFQRSALIVDVRLNPAPGAAPGEKRLLSLCNVHLDSLSGPMRPVQWAGIARHLQQPFAPATRAASILAGDCNATLPVDETAPLEHGFRDAYLELGGWEGAEEGYTWGFQGPRRRFPARRLDKVVYWGEGVEVRVLAKVGVGLQVEEAGARRALENEVGKGHAWVTDHYGLGAVFVVAGGFDIRRG